MFNHEPPDYVCPFCNFLAGNETEHNKNQDIVYKNGAVTAFVSPKWWINNSGHVIVVPNKHTENIYDISDNDLSEVYKAVKVISIAIRATYNCQGTSTRQHNEPAGNQDVFHLHTHVYPRCNDDNLYKKHDQKKYVGPNERIRYAQLLRNYFKDQSTESETD